MASPSSSSADDDWIAREIATTLHVLSLQSNPLKESPEAAVLPVPGGGGGGGGGSSKGGVSIELQRLEWLPEARTLRLSALPETGLTASSSSTSSSSSDGGGGGGLTRAQQLLLAAPVTVELFFPESPADPPLCFGSTDAAAMVAERVNEQILPLERSSLLHAVSRITTIIKQEADSIWPPSADAGRDYLRGFHARLSTHLQANPKASDLLLSLLSMAKPHHPSVRFPLPRFFYRGPPGKDAVDQPALLAALHAIPPLPTLVLPNDDEARTGAPPSLPFASCVLLHHLFFRSRVALLDPPTTPDDDDEYTRLLAAAGITALPPAQQPALVFRVAHAADARFTRPAQRHGTQVGFHGSPPGNFYSIVSLGLRNLSGTRGMRNGAVFGEGVYLASRLEVAREFGDWGTKVWPHSAFGIRPPGSDAAATSASASQQQPVFAYQVIALCEFMALDQYTKHLVKKAPASASPGKRPTAGGGGGGGGGGHAPSEYYVVEEDAHLVVRMLLLFKDPAILRQGRIAGGSTNAAGGAGAAAQSAAGGLPPQQQPQRRQRGWLDHLFGLVRAACFVVALVLLLDGLERLLVQRGKLHTPAATGGGRPRRPMR